MKLTLTSAALLLALLTLAPAAAGQTCTCSAPGKTSCSVTCSGGCSAVCVRKACWASCGDAESQQLRMRVTLTGNAFDAKAVSDQLTEQTGSKIVFTPRRPGGTHNFEHNNNSLYDVLTLLAKRGSVMVNGMDFRELQRLGAAMTGGGGASFKSDKLAVRKVLERLYLMTGRSFSVESGDPDALVSLSLPKATLREVIAGIEEKAKVKLTQTENAPLQ